MDRTAAVRAAVRPVTQGLKFPLTFTVPGNWVGCYGGGWVIGVDQIKGVVRAGGRCAFNLKNGSFLLTKPVNFEIRLLM